MTARLLEGPVRAMNWLAGWVDYGVAIVLAAGRRLRVPVRAAEAEFEPAYVRLAADGYEGRAIGEYGRPRWDGTERPSQPWFVRPAEVVMLSVSFFLAAHLVAGGTASVSAPQIRSWSLGASNAGPSQVSTVLVPSAATARQAASVTVTVEAPATAAVEAPRVEAPSAQATELEREPAPAAAPAPGLGAASVPAAEQEAPTPAPAAAETAPAEQPAPVPPAAVAPPPAVAAGALSYGEVVAAAAAAGWPADRLDQVARVVWCESRFRADAVGYGTYGLMQLIPFWFEATGTDFALWSDPVTNLRVALYAFSSGVEYGNAAWDPWSCKPDQVTLP